LLLIRFGRLSLLIAVGLKEAFDLEDFDIRVELPMKLEIPLRGVQFQVLR
jgi:hypothetical protein